MKVPRLALLLLVTAVLAWCIGVLYTSFLDPEMKFWTDATRQKLDWVEKMREKHGYVIGVVGGSTTTFGIDAEYIEREYNLPVANLGLHVGMGPEACIGIGLSALRKGDTLVLSLEPAAFTADYPEASKLGSKLALLLGRPEITTWDGNNPQLDLVRSLAMAPPGGYHVMTMLGKLALRMPPYRYSIANLQPGGLQVTEERRDLAAEMDFSSPDSNPQLSTLGARLLKNTRSAAEKRGIKLVYVLPWSYWPQETVDERRTANAALLEAIGRHVRVLIEPSLGAHSELQDFADSGQHLTAEAAAARSSVLAETLKADRGSSNHQ
jgi:hypothetical protein